MAFFALIGVLRGFCGCGVQTYASPQTLVRPYGFAKATPAQVIRKKMLISELDTHRLLFVSWMGTN
jgi:hypothetical protein